MKNTKPLFEQKILLQIISIIAAIVLWFAVVYSENPSTTRLITNINISFSGEKALEKNGLIFVNRDELPGITIEVRGKRSEVQSILNSVSAKVDLTDITEAGEYTRDVSYEIPNSSVMITKKKTTSVNIVIEKSVSKEIPVVVKQTGADKNKDYIIKSSAKINKLKISGTAEDLAKIGTAVVTVDVSEMNETNTGSYPMNFADGNYSSVTTSNHISGAKQSIAVENEVYFKRTAEIKLSPKYNDSGRKITVKSFSQEKIDVGVKDENTETAVVYAEFKDENAAGGSGKYEMTLIIPEEIYCPEIPKELTMVAEIADIVTREVQVTPGYENAASGTTVNLFPISFPVSATGTEAELAAIKAEVDLSGLEKGSYTLPVVFKGTAKINGEYSVNVTID